MKTTPAKSTICLSAILAIVVAAPIGAQTTWFVDENSTVSPPALRDGLSWSTPFEFLQDGLAVAQADDTIRVADGDYHPDDTVANPDTRLRGTASSG